MATIGSDSFPSQFNMAGSPIVLVLDDVLSGFPSGSTFRQMEITVSAGRPDSGALRDFVFLVDVDSYTLRIDIASAIRSMLMDLEYTPSWLSNEVISYPYVEFSVKYREKYMVEGEIYYGATTDTYKGSRAVAGRVSEMDRMRISAHVADYIKKTDLCPKPWEGMEIVPVGGYVIRSYVDSTSKTAVGKPMLISKSGTVTTENGRNVYALDNDGTLFQLLFVNSLGVLDTATAVCKESLSYDITTDTFSMADYPSNLKVAGMEAIKSGGHPILGMSSGFVNRKWADWWVVEVMRARKCWVRFGKRYVVSGSLTTSEDFWIPCIVTPKDDNVVVYDRSSQDMCYVEFELEICYEGSLLRNILYT